MVRMVKVLDNFKSQSFETPDEALDAVMAIYDQQLSFLREAFKDFVKNGSKVASGGRIRAFYPYARVFTRLARRSDTRLSYGFAPRPGTYSTTLTRPDIFRKYYHEQFRLLIKNHDVPIEVGVSETPIPIHFALGESFHLEGDLTGDQLKDLPDIFDVPNLDIMDDEIANSTYVPGPGQDEPLSLFTAPRVDLSLQRLKHYCGMPAEFFNITSFLPTTSSILTNSSRSGGKRPGKTVIHALKGRTRKGGCRRCRLII